MGFHEDDWRAHRILLALGSWHGTRIFHGGLQHQLQRWLKLEQRVEGGQLADAGQRRRHQAGAAGRSSTDRDARLRRFHALALRHLLPRDGAGSGWTRRRGGRIGSKCDRGRILGHQEHLGAYLGTARLLHDWVESDQV